MEFCVKKYNGTLSPVRISHEDLDSIDYKKVADIYVRKTGNPNIVKELKTGDKIPVIYEKILCEDSFSHTSQRKVGGSLSSPYFVLIHTNYYSSVKHNFTSAVSLYELKEYTKEDYKAFKCKLDEYKENAKLDNIVFLSKGGILVSSPWREKANAVKQKFQVKKEQKQLIKNMKEQRKR